MIWNYQALLQSTVDSAQTITGSLFSNTNTFHASTVSISGGIFYTLKTSASNNGSTDTLTSSSFNTDNNSLVVVIVSGLLPNGRASAPTISNTGTALTWTNRLDYSQTNAWASMAAVWTAPVTTGESGVTVTVDYNANSTNTDGHHMLDVISFTGHDTTTPVPQNFSDGGTAGRSGSYSGTLGSTPTTVNNYIITITANDSNGASASNLTPGSGWVQISEVDGSFFQGLSQYRTGSTSTNVAMANYTTNGAFSWVIGGVEIAAASSGGAPQNIDGALFTNTNTFYGSQIDFTIFTNTFNEADTFYASQVGMNVTGGLYNDPDTFYTSILGSVISGSLFNNTNTFYASQVDFILLPNLYIDTDTFYASTIAMNITGALYVDPDNFYGSTIAADDKTITGNLFIDPDILYTATITGGTAPTTGGGIKVLERRRRG